MLFRKFSKDAEQFNHEGPGREWLIAMHLTTNRTHSTTKHAKSKSISTLTRLSLKMKNNVQDYFISHQSKTVHDAFIVSFSTVLAFFSYAVKPRAVFETIDRLYRYQ